MKPIGLCLLKDKGNWRKQWWSGEGDRNNLNWEKMILIKWSLSNNTFLVLLFKTVIYLSQKTLQLTSPNLHWELRLLATYYVNPHTHITCVDSAPLLLFLSPVCILKWTFKWCDVLKVFPQYGQSFMAEPRLLSLSKAGCWTPTDLPASSPMSATQKCSHITSAHVRSCSL